MILMTLAGGWKSPPVSF